MSIQLPALLFSMFAKQIYVYWRYGHLSLLRCSNSIYSSHDAQVRWGARLHHGSHEHPASRTSVFNVCETNLCVLALRTLVVATLFKFYLQLSRCAGEVGCKTAS